MPRFSNLLRGAMIAATAMTMVSAGALAGDADFEGDDDHDNGAPFFGEAKDINGMKPMDGVRVKGEVVRVETSDDGHAGFALRFTEYLDGSEVILATHFLSPVLREFLAAYAKQHRFEASPEYIAHTADVLAAWELRRAQLGGDVWVVPGDRG